MKNTESITDLKLLEKELQNYNDHIQTLAKTDLVNNPPRVLGNSKPIIHLSNRNQCAFSRESIDVYLKMRNSEINKIKKNTNSKLNYKDRLIFAFEISTSNNFLRIQKNPSNEKEGDEEIYNLNPSNDNEKDTLKSTLKERLESNVSELSKHPTNYQSFNYLKTQFYNKLKDPLIDLEEVIKHELNTWINPFKEENPKGFFKLFKSAYKNIRISKTEENPNNYFSYYGKVLILEEKIQYEIFLNDYLLTEHEDKSYKSEILFQVGLLFASGKMEKFYTLSDSNKTIFKNEYTAPQVARELGKENYNKFILATINNYTKDSSNGNKNIFNSLEKMNQIIAHCEEKKISVIPYFKERLPIE